MWENKICIKVLRTKSQSPNARDDAEDSILSEVEDCGKLTRSLEHPPPIIFIIRLAVA